MARLISVTSTPSCLPLLTGPRTGRCSRFVLVHYNGAGSIPAELMPSRELSSPAGVQSHGPGKSHDKAERAARGAERWGTGDARPKRLVRGVFRTGCALSGPHFQRLLPH